MCKSGVDVPAVLEWIGISATYVDKLRYSDAGYYAMAYACYKIVSPVRYMVTVGSSTLTIKYLRNHGYMSTEELKDEWADRRDHLKDGFINKRNQFKEDFHEKREHVKNEWERAWRPTWEEIAKTPRKK